MTPLLDSRQLLAFVTVARTGRFTLAAEELFLTQSAVSHAIKSLEHEIGCRLFERGGQRVRLTSSGVVLRQHAERILADMAHARAELEPGRSHAPERLHIGASATACSLLLPPVLREFRRRHPACVLTVQPGDWQILLNQLRERKLDYALTLEPESLREFTFRPLFDDELCFLVPPDHPWVRKPPTDLTPAVRETLIVYPRSSLTFRLLSAHFQRAGLRLGPFIEAGSMDLIKELAKNGTGIGVLAPWVAHEELRDKTLCALSLGANPLWRRWGVLSRRNRSALPGESEFISLLASIAGAFTFTTGELARIRRTG
jgi:LysR family transcriptional regulator, low CO2-responsive transcriptional regulator